MNNRKKITFFVLIKLGLKKMMDFQSFLERFVKLLVVRLHFYQVLPFSELKKTKNAVFFLRVFPLTVIKIDTEGQSTGNIVVK